MSGMSTPTTKDASGSDKQCVARMADAQTASHESGSGGVASGPAPTCVRCRVTASTMNLPQTGSYCTSCATDIFHIKAKLGLDRARGACLSYAQRSRKGKERERGAEEPLSAGSSPEERGIAVGFSGSEASFMLLHAVAQYFLPDGAAAEDEGSSSAGPPAKSKRKKKDTRRMDTVAFLDVLYVDDEAALDRTGADAEATARAAQQRIAELERSVRAISPSFRFVPLRLEDIFRRSATDSDSYADYVLCTAAPSASRFLLPHSDEYDGHLTAAQALRRLHGAINPPPAQMPRLSLPAALTRSEDLRRILTHRLLRRTARERGACALLLGDTASGAAVRFIDAIAKGEGGKAAVEGAPAAWMNDLLICRPLREIHAQEVAFQVRALSARTGLPSNEDVQDLQKSASERGSIGRLTDGFIANLESNVASTVSTVTRTASKIVVDLPVSAPSEAEAGSSASAAANSKSETGKDEPAAKVKWDPSQITFGSAAQRLIRLAEEMPRWDELMQDQTDTASASAPAPPGPHSRACPLCGMPAKSEKAQGWKESISILATPAEVRQAANVAAPGSINLSATLCYGCALVLDTPPRLERAVRNGPAPVAALSSRHTMPLPVFVHDAAVQALRSAAQESSPDATLPEAADDSAVRDATSSLANGITSHLGMNSSPETTDQGEQVRLRKIDQEEMRARIGHFVLED